MSAAVVFADGEEFPAEAHDWILLGIDLFVAVFKVNLEMLHYSLSLYLSFISKRITLL